MRLNFVEGGGQTGCPPGGDRVCWSVWNCVVGAQVQ